MRTTEVSPGSVRLPVNTKPKYSQEAAAFLQRYDLSVMGVIAALAFLVSYMNDPNMPSASGIGWFGWWDQSQYLKTARDLASFKLTPSVYPLGYPFLGALFINILPFHPFFIPNMFFSIGIALLFYSIATTFVTRVEAAAITFAGVFAIMHFWRNTLVWPWSSGPVAFAFFLCAYLIVFRLPTLRSMALSSVAIGLAYFCRPPDAVFLVVVYGAGILGLKTQNERLHAVLYLVISMSAITVVVLADYIYVYGGIITPYMRTVGGIGFSTINFPLRLYQIFLDGNVLTTGNAAGVLSRMPWLVLVVPGAAIILRYSRLRAMALFAAMLGMACFYLSMNGMTPSNFWNYHGYRYLTWCVPLTLLFAYLTVSRAWKVLGWAYTLAGVVPALIFPLSLGWQGTVVGRVVAPTSKDESASSTARGMQMASFELNHVLRVTVETTPMRFDEIRLEFDRPLAYPVDGSISTRATVTADGQLLARQREYVVYQDNASTVSVLFNNAIGSKQPLSRVEVTFEGIEDTSVTRLTAIRAQFQPFGYLLRVEHTVAQLVRQDRITAYRLRTPFDLTGSAAGVPDGLADYAINCHLPASIRHDVADVEILVDGGKHGKLATHNRGLNWDKLVFFAGFLHDNLREPRSHMFLRLVDIPDRFDDITLVFRLLSPDARLTLVGLDASGQQLFVKDVDGFENR